MYEKEKQVIESQRKCADYYSPARILLESLYGEKWRSLKKKLENEEYYMKGVRELAKRAAVIRATVV